MKALQRTLGLVFLATLVFSNSMAQTARYTTNGGLTIGFGGGMAYQKSDLANSKGFGFDFILGSQLYKKENAFLSVDWKFRFLAGENKAYDHRINPDNTYSNIRYNFFTYDLELGLTLNRLRERTGIVLSGFAGAGITHGRTFTDLYDAESSLYDFSRIDPNLDKKAIYTDLRTLSDGEFETALVNKAALLPTAGIFLGYRFSRSFTMGVEFKTNFYLTEHNSFVGINLDNRDISGSAMDRNSYVSLGFRWKLGRGSATNSAISTSTYPISKTTEVDADPVTVSLPAPSVIITDPGADSFHTASGTHTLWAIVNHVPGSEHISLYQNGFQNHNFTYNTGTKILIAELSLREGQNKIRVQATNQTSSAEDLVIIYFDPAAGVVEAGSNPDIPPEEHVGYNPGTYNPGTYNPGTYNPGSGAVHTGVVQTTVEIHHPEEIALPTVRIVNPPTPLRVNTNRFPMKAETQNVRGRNDVKVRLNGANINNFSFSGSGGLMASLTLSEGVNRVEVFAENEAGSASGRTSITYSKPVLKSPPPVIKILSPETLPLRTSEQSEELRATVLNVKSKENITLKINGLKTRNFTYSSSTKLLATRVALRDGENVLTIQAQNEYGEDQASAKISFIPSVTTEPCVPPQVSLALNKVSDRDATHEIRGSVSGVKNKAEISLTLDGKPYRAFQFVPTRGDLSAKFRLIPGAHTIVVSVNNTCGADSKSVTVESGKPCSPPAVTLALYEVSGADATHEIRGSVSGVKNKAEISLTLDGRTYNGFQFLPGTGELKAGLKLEPGTHTIVVSANNACGTDSDSKSVKVEEEVCGPRINPGNSDWQFCLVTPSGTFSRDNLSNPNFSYSGSASSLYFMPIAGGGDAMVNGSPYSIRSGQYYLFTGNLNVTISTRNPGSMGHWSVCIRADRAPVSGNGSKRPASPCESQNNDKSKAKDDKKPKTNSGQSPKVNTSNSPKVKTGYSPRVNTGNSPKVKTSNSPKVKTSNSPKVKTSNSPKVKTSNSPKVNPDVRPRAGADERSSRTAGDRTKQTRTRR